MCLVGFSMIIPMLWLNAYLHHLSVWLLSLFFTPEKVKVVDGAETAMVAVLDVLQQK